MTEYARINYPNGEVRFCPMSDEDVTIVEIMYRDIQITADNCRERFSEHNERSFQNIGGMFCVQDRESLTRMSDGKQGFATVAKDKDGNILAFIRNAFPDPQNAYRESISYNKGLESWDALIQESSENGILARDGEIIVASRLFPRLWLPLFYVQHGLLLKKGFQGMSGEVYRVSGYHYEGRFHKADLLNKRSKNMLMQTGAVHLGEAPERTLVLDGLRVTVRPEVMLWDLQHAREIILQRMQRECFVCHESDK